jgi:hypothetical protein
MAKEKGIGKEARQHYQYALTGTVPGVGSIGGKKSVPKPYAHGGRAKPRGRG